MYDRIRKILVQAKFIHGFFNPASKNRSSKNECSSKNSSSIEEIEISPYGVYARQLSWTFLSIPGFVTRHARMTRDARRTRVLVDKHELVEGSLVIVRGRTTTLNRERTCRVTRRALRISKQTHNRWESTSWDRYRLLPQRQRSFCVDPGMFKDWCQCI